MVSIVIGTGGKQIKQIQERTRTNIYIDFYKLEENSFRSAKITGNIIQILGRMNDVAEGCRKIYELIELRSNYASTKIKVKNFV